MAKEPRICFVIMPFSATPACTEDEWSEFFGVVLKPAVEESGLCYECHRSAATSGNIVKAIVQSLNDAHVVVADLTDSNPNVFYELGVRHALTNRTILLAQDREFIPFDLEPYASHVYEWRSQEGRAALRVKLRELLREVDESPDRSDNPVSDFLSGRATPSPSVSAEHRSTTLKATPLGPLAGPGSERLDVMAIAMAQRDGAHKADWRTMVRQTRTYFGEVWPRRIEEITKSKPGGRIPEEEIYSSCTATIAEFAVDIETIEHLALTLTDGDDAEALVSLYRIFEDWIAFSARPRSGPILRAAAGAPELLAFRILTNCGAKAADNLSVELLHVILDSPLEAATSSGQNRLAPLIERRNMFFSEGMLGFADLTVLYVARESWKSGGVRAAFASQQDFNNGLARFLFLAALVTDVRFPDKWGPYPGFKLIPGASAAIAALIQRLSANPELVAAVASLAGEAEINFRERFPERINAINKASLGHRYWLHNWDNLPLLT